ncbi:MAG: 3-deoxy-manno-octulosonate cytidylyltransferase, partial [Legionellales bacterium]|nr:3-deoxy-manno-octulosonate cytidylyltransferase [Legionellales bacterium]
MNSVIFIPSRKGSTRFPNKPMSTILGKTLISRVWSIAKQSTIATDTIITTDSIEIKKHCESFGAKVIMTPEDCPCGKDRIAEEIKQY